MKRVAVFCGSSPGTRLEYTRAAQAMGTALAGRDLELIFGGGHTGLMGVLADAMLVAGGRAVGVMPQALVEKEVAHQSLSKGPRSKLRSISPIARVVRYRDPCLDSELHITRSMHERKAKMAELADAFIALPGGFGTYDEFCEIITWAQLGYHRKPIGLLNVAGFYDGLLTFFDQAVTEGFIRSQHRAIIQVADDPAKLLDALAAYQPTYAEKWVDRDDL